MSKKKIFKKLTSKPNRAKINLFKKNSRETSKKKKATYSLIEAHNPLLPHLDTLFSLLFSKFNNQLYILKKLNLNKNYSNSLKHILEHLKKYSLIKTGGDKYKLNIKYIKDTNIPKYCLLKISSKNSLGEPTASFPTFFPYAINSTIIVDDSLKDYSENTYFLAKLTVVNKHILKANVLSIFPIYSPELIKGLITFKENIPFLIPLGRKYKFLFNIVNAANFEIKQNTLVEAKVVNNTKFNSEVFITQILSSTNISTDLSLLTAYEFDIPLSFNEATIKEANNVSGLPSDLNNYTDLRHLPLVTIDGKDAQDFDDAVYVEPISYNPIKYKATVAIADVSSYVKEDSLLNKEALLRGNSTYLPGLVLPMLPPRLSNNWCSLKPNEDRASLAVDLIINHHGIVEDYNFYKAIIKSKARLTYEEVEDALNGRGNNTTKPLIDKIILPLYQCWKLLNKATLNRNALQIQAKEYQVEFNEDNKITSIIKKVEKQSHKIISELMIAANVAAAHFLKKHKLNNLTIYRVHQEPSTIKIEHFLAILKSLSIKTSSKDKITPKFFNNLLSQYQNSNTFDILNENVLSTQSQAKYSTNNIGHFGLALKDYCHFTSPIRRYADLIIHRLISNILTNTSPKYQKDNLEEIANMISLTERNSSSAEYSALEKIIASLLQEKIGDIFQATIVNITNAGLFIALEDYGAQGLIPMRTLGNERFILSKEKNILIGVNTKTKYKVGQHINAILTEVNILKGLLTFTFN